MFLWRVTVAFVSFYTFAELLRPQMLSDFFKMSNSFLPLQISKLVFCEFEKKNKIENSISLLSFNSKNIFLIFNWHQYRFRNTWIHNLIRSSFLWTRSLFHAVVNIVHPVPEWDVYVTNIAVDPFIRRFVRKRCFYGDQGNQLAR